MWWAAALVLVNAGIQALVKKIRAGSAAG